MPDIVILLSKHDMNVALMRWYFYKFSNLFFGNNISFPPLAFLVGSNSIIEVNSKICGK